MSLHGRHCCKKHGCFLGDQWQCPVFQGYESGREDCPDCASHDGSAVAIRVLTDRIRALEAALREIADTPTYMNWTPDLVIDRLEEVEEIARAALQRPDGRADG